MNNDIDYIFNNNSIGINPLYANYGFTQDDIKYILSRYFPFNNRNYPGLVLIRIIQVRYDDNISGTLTSSCTTRNKFRKVLNKEQVFTIDLSCTYYDDRVTLSTIRILPNMISDFLLMKKRNMKIKAIIE